VTGRYGTIGNVFYVEEDFWPLNTTLFVSDFHDNDPLFVSYLLRTIDFKSHSGKSGVPGVNRNDIHELDVAIPPTVSEQEAIAEALSDADALIESLEQLIAKKRLIKQGVMQELLTGKRRLPGFETKPGFKQTEVGLIPKDWEVDSLGNISNCLDNLRIPLSQSQRAKIGGAYPYCGANGVVDHINDYIVDNDIILMAEDGGNFDQYMTRPIAYRVKGKCWVNNHAHILTARSATDQDYLFYSLVHKNILSYISSGTRAKLNKSEMLKIEIGLPPSKREQAAIAATLSDIDTDLDATSDRLRNTQQLKQGMMEQLLTGKIRLT